MEKMLKSNLVIYPPCECFQLVQAGSTTEKANGQEPVQAQPDKAQEQAKKEAEERARKEAEEKAQKEAEEKAKKEAEEKAQKEAEEKAKKQAEEKAQKEAEEKAKKEAEEKAQKEAEEKAKKEAEEKAQKEAEEKAKKEAEEKAQKEAEEKARKEAEEKAQKEAEEKARKEAEEKAQKEAEEKARKEAEEKAQKEAEEKAKKEAEEKAEKEAEEKARKEAEEKAQKEAEEKAKKEAEEKAQKEAEEKAKKEAEEKAEKEAEASLESSGTAEPATSPVPAANGQSSGSDPFADLLSWCVHRTCFVLTFGSQNQEHPEARTSTLACQVWNQVWNWFYVVDLPGCSTPSPPGGCTKSTASNWPPPKALAPPTLRGVSLLLLLRHLEDFQHFEREQKTLKGTRDILVIFSWWTTWCFFGSFYKCRHLMINFTEPNMLHIHDQTVCSSMFSFVFVSWFPGTALPMSSLIPLLSLHYHTPFRACGLTCLFSSIEGTQLLTKKPQSMAPAAVRLNSQH